MIATRYGIKLRAYFLAALLACSGLSSALPLIGSLQLQGQAVYSQLQRDYYIAQLYGTDSKVDIDSAQMMQVTILAGEWSKRSFYQYWTQAVSINNTAVSLESLSEDLVAFRNMIKGSLKEGDQLVVSRQGRTKTKISINTIELLETPSDKLFLAMLRSWIGARPPSSQFKAAITGASPKQTMPEHTVAGANREQEIRSWLKQTDSLAKTKKGQNTSTRKTKAPADTVTTGTRNTALPLATLATSPGVQPAKAKTPPNNDATGTIKPAIATPIETPGKQAAAAAIIHAAPAITATQQPSTLASNTIEPASQTIALTPTNPPAATGPDTPSTPGTAIESTSEENLAKNTVDEKATNGPLKVYRSNLLKLTYQNLIYPTGAINRNQQGKVVLQVTLNRQGKVKDVGLEQPSEYSLLNRAATKAVKKSGPFPAVPDAIQGKEVVVSLPVNFVLAN